MLQLILSEHGPTTIGRDLSLASRNAFTIMRHMLALVCKCEFTLARLASRCGLSEPTNRVSERIVKGVSRITCSLMNELSVNSIEGCLLVCLYALTI